MTTDLLTRRPDGYYLLPTVVSFPSPTAYIFADTTPGAVSSLGPGDGVSRLVLDSEQPVQKLFCSDVVAADMITEEDLRFSVQRTRDEVAFGVGRGFVRVGVDGTLRGAHTMVDSLHNEVGPWAPLPGTDGHVVIEEQVANGLEAEQVLKVVAFDVGDRAYRVLATHHIGPMSGRMGDAWQVAGNRILIRSDRRRLMYALDFALQPADHPLCDLVNRHARAFRACLAFAVHPTLPLAVFSEGGLLVDRDRQRSLPESEARAYVDSVVADQRRRALWLARWDHSDTKKRFIPIVSPTHSIFGDFTATAFSGLSFSPDGEWCVFRDDSDEHTPRYCAMRVEPDKDELLGAFVRLGGVLRTDGRPRSACWSTGPLSWCVADGLCVYRWELGGLDLRDAIRAY